MRSVLLTGLVAVLYTASSFAQSSRADLFVGYSLAHANLGSGSTNLNGFAVTYTVRPRLHAQWLGIVAEMSLHFGTAPVSLIPFCVVPSCVPPNINSDVRVFNSLFGVRFSQQRDKFTPFAHALIGGSSISASGTGVNTGINQSRSGLAYAVGGGIDYRPLHRFGWRVQGDFLQTHLSGNFQTDARFSTGPVIYY